MTRRQWLILLGGIVGFLVGVFAGQFERDVPEPPGVMWQ